MKHKVYIKMLSNIHANIQKGWSQYSLYFYIGGVSAIIGGFFKLAGIASLIITLAFFYIMGKMHAHIETE
ncbi:MAG: hypothetical protein QXD11_00625 [Candidatus Micrarchaeaceae archaeon]